MMSFDRKIVKKFKKNVDVGGGIYYICIFD